MKQDGHSANDGTNLGEPCDNGGLSLPGRINHAPDGRNIRETFARNLRLWRTWRDLPMKVVAGDVGVDESTYCLWEAGKRFPNAENLDAIAMYAGVPICRFFKNGESACSGQSFEEFSERSSGQSNPEPTGQQGW